MAVSLCTRPLLLPPRQNPAVDLHVIASSSVSYNDAFPGCAQSHATVFRVGAPPARRSIADSCNARSLSRVASCPPGAGRCTRGCRASTGASHGSDGGQAEKISQQFDVSSNCVQPVFRSPPVRVRTSESVDNGKVKILFVSEGNICRSVYAEAIFTALLHQNGLQELVECSSKAVRDYNEGEAPDERVVSVANEFGLQLQEGKVSTVFECSIDVVEADLVLVFDKFNASDVLKEVTIYETVDKTSKHTGKVRRLGEFCQSRMIEDIEDPLYGNMGGPEELELLREVYNQIRDSCEGLLQHILDIRSNLIDSETLKQGVRRSIGRMDALNWLVPPMLSRA